MAQVPMTIMPACGPTIDFSLGGVSSEALARGKFILGATSSSFLLCGCLGLTLTTITTEVNIADSDSLRLAFGEAIACSSEEPAGPDLYAHAFRPVRRGPESIAAIDAYTGPFCPHFMLKGPVGSAERFALGIHQPAHVRHQIKVLSAAGGLRNLLDIGVFDDRGGGLMTLPPVGLPIRPVSQVRFD